jgi:hypothetical protein
MKNELADKPLLVFCHSHCLDGAAAAWVFWRRFPDAEIHFVQYGKPVPVDVTGRVVVVADFCFDLETTIDLISKARSYTMLDHHPMARRVVQGVTDWANKMAFPISAVVQPDNGTSSYMECDAVNGRWGTFTVRWNEEESGAMQAWKFCYPDIEPLDMIRYHDDHDRWVHKYPNTDSYITGLGTYPLRLDTFKKLFDGSLNSTQDEDNVNNQTRIIVGKGSHLVTYRKSIVDSIVKETKHYLKVRDHDGVIHNIPVANSPKQLVSHVSHALSHESPDTPFSLVYYDTAKGRVYRFGSSKTGLNVTPIAEFWGGGGHAHASGTVYNKRGNLFTPWNGFVQRFKRYFKLDVRR